MASSKCTQVIIALAIALGAACTGALAQDEPVAQPTTYLKLRAGPGEDYTELTTLPPGELLALEARDRFVYWVRVHTIKGGAAGWVSTCCLSLDVGVSLADLPVDGAPVEAAPPADAPAADEPQAPLPPINISEARAAQLVAKLESVPVLPAIGGRVYQIFAAGQVAGNRPDVFSKIGDCLTETEAFLTPFGQGNYYLSEEYADLQATVDFFSVSPREGIPNSFANISMAVIDGLTAATALDLLWADPARCQPGETPVACELNLTRPSVAVIMFGTVDIQAGYTPAQFRQNLSQIVRTAINHGTIPVLTTFPVGRDFGHYSTALEFNSVVIDVARSEGIPLINFWRAAQALPNHGLSSDDWHPSFGGDFRVSFDGYSEFQWGHTLRNLLTLQTLDILRREVLAR